MIWLINVVMRLLVIFIDLQIFLACKSEGPAFFAVHEQGNCRTF